MYDVFISHSSEDTEAAAALAGQLRSRNLDVFLDVDSLRPGDQWQGALLDAQAAASATVVLVSAGSLQSKSTSEEVELAQRSARDGNSLLIPIVLGDLALGAIPEGLQQFQSIRIHERADIGDAAEAVTRALSATRFAHDGGNDVGPARRSSADDAVLLERELADSARNLGPDHPSTLNIRAKLARVLMELGQDVDALALLERNLHDTERVLGPDDPSTLSMRSDLANLYVKLGRNYEALLLLESALADSERILGLDHHSTQTIRANLAGVYMEVGRYEKAAELLEQTLADNARALGPDHPTSLNIRANLAGVYMKLGRDREAADLLADTLADCERVLGLDHPSTQTIRANLAVIVGQAGGGASD